MSRISNGRINLDSANHITIGKPRDWGLLKERSDHKDITMSWSVEGKVIGQVNMIANMREYSPYVVLGYVYGNEDRQYKLT